MQISIVFKLIIKLKLHACIFQPIHLAYIKSIEANHLSIVGRFIYIYSNKIASIHLPLDPLVIIFAIN